jgi:hypothetical protein
MSNLEASHRNSWLRKLQNNVSWMIPGLISLGDKIGLFPNTKIHLAKTQGEKIQADDITLSQLQLIKNICDQLKTGNIDDNLSGKFLLATLLDGADGPVARRNHTVSKIGGIKDAAVDRLSEIMIAKLVADEIGLPPEKLRDLCASFQLSTITKAACEMIGAKTSEGGVAGMIQRRLALHSILKDLMRYKKTKNNNMSINLAIKKKIEAKIESLINDGRKRAIERINSIQLSRELYNRDLIGRNEVGIEGSSAEREAIKYIGIVILNNRLGIDIVGELNKMTYFEIRFPTVEELVDYYPNLKTTLNDTQTYLETALEIAGV